MFRFAPYVVLMGTFATFVVIPFGPDLAAEKLDVGIFFLLAVSSLSTLGVLMAGWSSANKYSLIGGLRAAAQLIAYELPMVLAVVGVVIQAGSMNLQDIVVVQNTGEIFGFGGLGNPFVLTQFVGFVIFMIAVQAELTQAPFDMPIAESELTMGHTAVDFWHVTDRPHNVDWAYAIDADGFYDLLVERVARFGD